MKRSSSATVSSALERSRPITRIIAVANQKGGVGKTTTAVSLGAALAERGHRVLVVDLDPQGNASTGLGIRHDSRQVTVYDVLAAEAPIEGAIIATPVEGLFAIPSTIDLAGAEIELVSQFSRELRLRRALEPLHDGTYAFVFLDCPPSLGLLTVNALAAAEELIVPIQCEYYALEGLGQLLRNVRLVQQNVNPRLRLTGIVLTMFDPRTKLSEQVVEEVRRYFGDRVYASVIPRTVRLSEAPGYGQPITAYDPKSRGAESYRALAKEVEERIPVGEPVPIFEDAPTAVGPPSEPTSREDEAVAAKAKAESVAGARVVAPSLGQGGTDSERRGRPRVGDTEWRPGRRGRERGAGAQDTSEEPGTGAVDRSKGLPRPVRSKRDTEARRSALGREGVPAKGAAGSEAPSTGIDGDAGGPAAGAAPRLPIQTEPGGELADVEEAGEVEEPPSPPTMPVEEPPSPPTMPVEEPRRKRWRLFRKGGNR